MSTDYRPLTPIRMADLFDGRLEKLGVQEQHSDEATPNSKCLTDGRNFLCFYGNEEGLASAFTRYGDNAPQRILRAISQEFNVKIVSEYAPQYWGFSNEEEAEAFWREQNEKSEREFYNEVVKFVCGQSHNIKSGTIGMNQAEIAKRLIAESPDLLSENKRSDLIKAVNMVYQRDHATVVTLPDEELALVRMAATHEDDLPQA